MGFTFEAIMALPDPVRNVMIGQLHAAGRSAAVPTAVHELLALDTGDGRSAWFVAKTQTGNLASYLEDLHIAGGERAPPDAAVRYALYECSIRDAARRLSPGLVAALLKHDELSVAEARTLVAARNDPVDRFATLLAIYEVADDRARAEFEPELLEAARIAHSGDALCELLRVLPAERHDEIVALTPDDARSLSAMVPLLRGELARTTADRARRLIDALSADDTHYLYFLRREAALLRARVGGPGDLIRIERCELRTKLVAGLDDSSREQTREALVADLRAIEDRVLQYETTARCIAELPERLRLLVVTEVVDLVVDDVVHYWKLAEYVASHLTVDQQDRVLAAALDLDPRWRARLLVALLPHRPPDDHPGIVEAIVSAVSSLEPDLAGKFLVTAIPFATHDQHRRVHAHVTAWVDEDRAPVLIALARVADDQLVPRPTAMLRALPPEPAQAGLWSRDAMAVVTHSGDSESTGFENRDALLRHRRQRACEVVVELSALEEPSAWRALARERRPQLERIGDGVDRGVALATIAAMLAGDDEARLLDEALALVEPGARRDRAEILAVAATATRDPAHARVLAHQAYAAARDPFVARSYAIIVEIAPLLDPENVDRVIVHLRQDTANDVVPGVVPAQMIALASGLPDDTRLRIVTEALHQIRAVDDPSLHLRALFDAVPYMPPPWREQTARDVLQFLDDSNDTIERTNALANSLPHVSEALRTRTLADIEAVLEQNGCPHCRQQYRAVVGALGPKLRVEAIRDVLAVDRETVRLRLLDALVARLLAAQVNARHVLNAAIATVLTLLRSDAMRGLARLLPLVHYLGGDDALRNVAVAITTVGRWWP